ncbi:MAG: hypothetical protein WAW37_06910 [Syntrophobacteraceae bacterium]
MWLEELIALIKKKQPSLLDGLDLKKVTINQAQELINRAIEDSGERKKEGEGDMQRASQGMLNPRIGGGIGQRDKIQMALDLAMGLKPKDITRLSKIRQLNGYPAFENMRAAQDYDVLRAVRIPSSIREFYVMLTGDGEMRGIFNRRGLPADLRAAQDINSGTFSFLLGNSLGRRMVSDYLAVDYGENLLISVRKPVKDFRAQEAVLVGYFPDLETVDPEAADYNEIGGITDEESSYVVGQKGNILTITRKMIVNDDLSLIQRMGSRLGRAARRSHAKYVWALFITNSNCSDGTAWFTVGHGNLGAVALTHANALAAYTALALMTENDSGERLGLLADPNIKPTLVYPINLMSTGESIVTEEEYYTANDLTTKVKNPLRGKINGAQIPLATDVDDWGLLLPPEIIDMVEMGYLNGREEPEMFLNDSPQGEQVFMADKLRYKIRHEYAGTVIDHRSGYKSVVP